LQTLGASFELNDSGVGKMLSPRKIDFEDMREPTTEGDASRPVSDRYAWPT